MPKISKLPIVEVQEGGSGANAWKILGFMDNKTMVIMSAPDLGKLDYVDQVARDYKNGGQLVIVDTMQSGKPEPTTFDLSVPVEQLQNFAKPLAGKHNIRVRYINGDYSVATAYNKMLMYANCYNTSQGKYSRDLANNTENKTDALMLAISQRAQGEVLINPVARQSIGGTLIGFAITKIVSLGSVQVAGLAGATQNNDGLQEYACISAKNGSNLSAVHYTSNKGSSWTTLTLTGFTNFDGSGVCKAGPNMVVSGIGSAGGVLYTSYSTFVTGTTTWTRSTGIAAGTVINGVVAVTNSLVYAYGASGAVYKSTDSGMTFTSAGTAVTANALSECAVVDESLIWFGGASGTLVKLYNGVMSTVTVTGISTNAVTALASPGVNRGTEVYLGAADGKVYKSIDTGVTWTTPSFDLSGASGAVDALAFAGVDGAVLWISQTNGSTQSRILRDFSGGNFGNDCEVLGSFTSPANATITSLAAADQNTAMAVGPVQSSYGYIELIS